MSSTSDDEIVITNGPSSRQARFYRWVLDHLAKFPGRVTAVTFVAGVSVTMAVVAMDGDGSPTTVISLIATLWALFFSVMIYLLTARDTDTVLDQIADLHEQLATALAAPDEEDDEYVDTETATEEQPSPEAVEPPSTPTEPPTAPATHSPHEGPGRRRPRPGDGGQHRVREVTDAGRRPRVLDGHDSIVDGVPGELLNAWASATGKNREELSRAWTRDPRTDRQWVLETATGQRWVVFSKGDRGVGVMPLDRPGGRGGRDARRAAR